METKKGLRSWRNSAGAVISAVFLFVAMASVFGMQKAQMATRAVKKPGKCSTTLKTTSFGLSARSNGVPPPPAPVPTKYANVMRLLEMSANRFKLGASAVSFYRASFDEDPGCGPDSKTCQEGGGCQTQTLTCYAANTYAEYADGNPSCQVKCCWCGTVNCSEPTSCSRLPE